MALLTQHCERHGLINTLTNSVPFDDFKHMQPNIKKEVERQKKEDAKIVRAEYMNSRGRHERLTKPYCRYAGDPIQIYHLIPGMVYDLPLGFVNEVNDKNKIMKKRADLLSVDDNNVQKTGAPLAVDQDGDYLHKLIPVSFTAA